MKSKRIAVFASGTGSNTIKLAAHFEDKAIAEIALIASNKNTAGILSNSVVGEIPKLVFDRTYFYSTQQILKKLEHHQIDFIVLAGFLWKIPDYLIKAYPNKIINIHPALLPSYGGKGMYGMNVHEAVFQNKEKQSGMTIHFVNEQYDEGAIIFQSNCDISDAASADEIARRVLVLEHKYYAQVVEQVICGIIPDFMGRD